MGNSIFEISVCASSFGEIHGNFYDSKLPYALPEGNVSKDVQDFFDNALQNHLKAVAFCYIKRNLKFSDHAKETLNFVKSFHENCKKNAEMRDKTAVFFTAVQIQKLAYLRFKEFDELVEKIEFCGVRNFTLEDYPARHAFKPSISLRFFMRKENSTRANNDFLTMLIESNKVFFDKEEIYPLILKYKINEYVRQRDHGNMIDIFKNNYSRIFNKNSEPLCCLDEIKCYFGNKKHNWECFRLKWRPTSFDAEINQRLVYRVILQFNGHKEINRYVEKMRLFLGLRHK